MSEKRTTVRRYSLFVILKPVFGLKNLYFRKERVEILHFVQDDKTRIHFSSTIFLVAVKSPLVSRAK